jgi:nicotinamidase-related amidase
MEPMEGLRAALAAVDAYYKERGIFQGRFGFGQCPALVVIDMAYGWTDPAYAGGSSPQSAADFSPNFRRWDRRACDIDERLRPLPGDYVLYKEHASAFAGTPLIGHLVGRRVDTLLITGCSTSACVRATATDAKSCGLRPVVVREAVQDRSEVAHEWTLFDIQARFADVVGLEETLAYLRSLPAR